MIDLRSDTVTHPTPEMRRAMAEAEVGDDVYREDPTVRALEEEAAGRLGKEAALLFPTGTMANQVAVRAWAAPGRRVILEARCHIALVEAVPLAMLAGVVPDTVRSADGSFTARDLQARLEDPVMPAVPALVCVENTHNMAGGRVFPQDRLIGVAAVARERGLPVHLDGARIFNAAAATGLSAAVLAEPVDSVMFCLSKGLCAPVGSLLCGPRAFVEECRALRTAYGGAMRQAGVIAAAGLVALRTMTERLAEDHRRARLLAEGLADLPGLSVGPVDTNIVMVRCADAAGLCTRLRERGVLAFDVAADQVRLVTHQGLDDEAILRAVGAAGA